MAALPVVALGLLAMPQSMSDRARVMTAPLFAPFQDMTAHWSLDLTERLRQPEDAGAVEAVRLQDRVASLENALAGATALLGDYDRQVRLLARLREGLDGLPCRLVPARLLAPEVVGGRASARLGQGSDKGIRKNGAVVSAAIDRGAREALARGEPVLTAAGLVGLVDEVGPLTSTVRLLTDPRTNLMVQVITRRDGVWRAGPEGVARGAEDGTGITVQGISRTADVAPGDFVVTSPSPESALPPYLVVGRVVRCELKPTALFYELVIEPRVTPAEARDVVVLSPDMPAPAAPPTPRRR